MACKPKYLTFLHNKHTALRKPSSEYCLAKQFQFVVRIISNTQKHCLDKWQRILTLNQEAHIITAEF